MHIQTVKPHSRAVLLALSSFAGGVLNGLLGTGGGIILLFALTMLLSPEHTKEAFVISSAAVLVFSAVSVLFYGRGNGVHTGLFPPLAMAAAGGGIVGALLLDRLSTGGLRKIMAVLFIYTGAKMLGVFPW